MSAFSSAGVWALSASGALTLDVGVGRRVRALGPISRAIAAPPETVFDVIAAPYAQRTTHALREKVRVLERGADMVLAAHFTPVVRGITVTTVETVRMERPECFTFRLVRGPVAHVAETFDLTAQDDGTVLVYEGELGTDGWALGEWWGAKVARSWERAVAESLEAARMEAERLTAR